VARAFTALGGVGYARCDLRMTPSGEIHLLELNANCGVFLPPDISAADEMVAEEPGGRRAFLEHIIACALRRHAARTPCWTLEHERGRGFGLAAARPIRAGEVILARRDSAAQPGLSDIYRQSLRKAPTRPSGAPSTTPAIPARSCTATTSPPAATSRPASASPSITAPSATSPRPPAPAASSPAAPRTCSGSSRLVGPAPGA
jgi:hypothetical protein